MRVPQSPKSLRRVMTVSSVSRDDDEGAGSSSDDGVNNNNNNFKKSRTNANEAARPPRPTYTARYKDGKYTVGVEATLFTAKVEIQNDKSENGESKNADEDPKRVDPAPPSFHRSRDRTRISAVQRLVERKLAQKERERLRERELERDRLGHSLGGKLRSSSSGGSCYVRERSWDPTYRRNISCSAAEQSNNDGDASQSDVKSRSEKENEYLASLLWRTSRSCSGTRRRGTQSDCEEEVAKTIITIGPGKPTRIREHSPSKRSPTSEQPPYTFENEKEDKPTPLNLKAVPPARDPSPSKKSESRFQNSSPLKSTGLFREFSRTTTTTSTSSFSTSSKPNDRQRKTSFTTERTFQVNVDKEAAEKARKLSIDCNYVYERSTPTFSTFSQSESQKTSSTSSLSSSSFSSTSSADSGTEKEPIRLSRLRAPTFAKEKSPELVSDPNPEPPIRERKTSRRIFISSAFNNKPSDISADETSSSASSTEDSVVNGSDDAGSQFSSASSRLLFNLSSGYRYHRAAAAANSTLHTVNINVTNCATNNKTFNTNDATYPRRRFSQEHAPLEEDAFDEHVFVTKPARQPVRKISLPVRPMREAPAMRREVSRSDDSNFCSAKMLALTKGAGPSNANTYSGGGGGGGSSTLNSLSKFKLCDDSLFYPGCCVEHDRLSLGERHNSISRNSFFQTNNFSGDGAQSGASLHALSNNNYNNITLSVSPLSSYGSLDSQSAELSKNLNVTDNFLQPNFFSVPEQENIVDNNESNLLSDNQSLDDDEQSISTLSGSGMDFFRKLVQRKDKQGKVSQPGKDESLIDRLIQDSHRSLSIASTRISEQVSNQEFSLGETKNANPGLSRTGSISLSSISGSGFLYLRNILRKKNSTFKEEEVPKQTNGGDSRSDSRRSSCSTLADLLDETFDTEDSELKRLDWDEFEDSSILDNSEFCDITEDDISLDNCKSQFLRRDTCSIKLGPMLSHPIKIRLDPYPDAPVGAEPIQKLEPKVIINPKMSTLKPLGFNALNFVSGKEKQALIQSMKEIEPIKKLLLSSPTICHSKKEDQTKENHDKGSKEALTNLNASNSELGSTGSKSSSERLSRIGFRPAVPSSYDTEARMSADERVRLFLEATKKAAECVKSKGARSRTFSLSDDTFADRRHPIDKRCSIISNASSLD